MDTPKRTDFVVFLMNLETREFEVQLCSAETSTEAAVFMTQQNADRGMDAIGTFPREEIMRLCIGGYARVARPPLPVEEYTKLRQWVLNDPKMAFAANVYGGGTAEGLHDNLPEFIERYREQLQEKMANTKKEP